MPGFLTLSRLSESPPDLVQQLFGDGRERGVHREGTPALSPPPGRRQADRHRVLIKGSYSTVVLIIPEEGKEDKVEGKRKQDPYLFFLHTFQIYLFFIPEKIYRWWVGG